MEAVRRITRAARTLGIEALTLYAFSSENWRRPDEEIGDLMGLLRIFIRSDLDEMVRENVRLRGLLLGMSAAEVDAYAGEISAFSGLGSYLDLPVKIYSSGMLLRLMFAVTTAISPQILLLDEWITAGDSAFMERAEQRVNGLIDRSALMVIATHNRVLVERLCNKVAVLEQGRVVEFGPLTPHLLDRAMAA